MGEYGTEGFHFEDPAIRHLDEKDIPAVISLFKLNYGADYPWPKFYDDTWYKHGIYSEDIIWLVLEEEGVVISSGAVDLRYGDYNDQIGVLGRLVVHPEHKGRGLARRIIEALLDAADDSVEFAYGEARTAHAASQTLMDRSGFAVIGFFPEHCSIGEHRESSVLYGQLYGTGRALRSKATPKVIPEVANLASHVLAAMNLPTALNIVDDCLAYPSLTTCTTQRIDRKSLARLAAIEYGRLVEPLLFGGVSLDQGLSFIRRRNAAYLMAVDDDGNPVGAVGYVEDKTSKLFRGIELVAERSELRGSLCNAMLREAEKLGAEIIEVNVSAYDPRLQCTFAAYGFRPVAYAPAMIFHGTHRLDVIKMVKLNVGYNLGNTMLTEKSKAVVSIVETGFA